MKRNSLVFLSAVCMLGPVALAQTKALEPENDQTAAEAPVFSFSLTPASRVQFPADLGDAQVGVFRSSTELGVFAPLSERLSAALSLKFESSRYSWKDFDRVLPGVDRPMRDGAMLMFSPTLSYDIDEKWTFTGGGLLMFAAADGADWGDAATYGGFAVAKHKFSDSFSLSGGLIASSRLEEDALVFPLINFEWQVDDRWRLETTGLGIRGSYKASDTLTAFADVGYEFREYRLKNNLGGGLGGGVFRDNAAIAGLGVQWKPAERWTLEATAGLVFGGDARFDDANGNRIRKIDSDAAPFVGLSIRLDF